MKLVPSSIQPTSRHYFVHSYAKINLTLDVLGKRADGYHELATIMQTVDLFDTLHFSITDDEEVHLSCTKRELNTPTNLVVRAAEALRQHLGIRQGLCIELQKQVPMAAGLGGGSSNAAVTLLALTDWWQLPLTSTDLLPIAASLGSDVPFFLFAGLAYCTGRGEHVKPLAPYIPSNMLWLLLLKPAISVSTPAVFKALPASDYTDDTHSRAIKTALLNKKPLPVEDLHNGLERNVLLLYPEVEQARAALLNAGAPLVRLSGSGPTLFAPFSDLASAAEVHAKLHGQYEVYLTHPIFPSSLGRKFI